jgi:glyoxylase-like metal-dependent hydrolase (beta-lactamase superfamily II)
VEKVADDLFLVRQPLKEDWFCVVTVVFGEDQIALVDTGLGKTPVDHIFPFIQRQGRGIEEINLVVNTHRDMDHVGGNRTLKAWTGAKIAIHELEADSVKLADVQLKDGDSVGLGNREFSIVHTPGHRPGSICLYDEGDRLLISGDSVCGEVRHLIRRKKAYIASLGRLLGMDVVTMIMSHPFQPMGRCVLMGDDPRRMIESSIEIATER